MTIKTINYLSLSRDQRKPGAEKQRERLRGLLASPILTDDQRQVVLERLDYVGKWERGEIELELMEGEEAPPEVLQKFKDKKDLAAKRAAGPDADKGKDPDQGKGKDHKVVIDEDVPVDEG